MFTITHSFFFLIFWEVFWTLAWPGHFCFLFMWLFFLLIFCGVSATASVRPSSKLHDPLSLNSRLGGPCKTSPAHPRRRRRTRSLRPDAFALLRLKTSVFRAERAECGPGLMERRVADDITGVVVRWMSESTKSNYGSITLITKMKESFSLCGCKEHSSAPLSLHQTSIMSPSICRKITALLAIAVILLLLSISGFRASLSEARINQLPGFDGILPFHLETGYVTVDEERGAELFYYFAESERNPSEDPLILWLIGGPYCSAFVGFALDIGPVKFKIEQYNGTLPTLIYNPYSWTKISSILFLDWPVGAGFSFARSIEDYVTDEVQSSNQIYKFLKKWLLDHPSFLSNPFYVGGDSYGGKMAPLVALEIVGGNEGFQLPLVNLKGYLIGNPVTGERIDITSQAPHAHGLGIISDELLKLIETNCEGEDYLNTKNALCAANLKIFNEFLSEINIYDILEPKCVYTPSNIFSEARKSLEEKTSISLGLQSEPNIDCTNGPLLSYYWANNNLTKEALHIKQGTVEEWQRCRTDLNNYTYNIASSVPHHLNLISKGYRALVYSGDHDLDVPFIGTLDWVKSLNFSILEEWHSWHVGGQVAGYSVLFSNNLTLATVKGGSHTPPDNMPRQSFSMFERWISHQLL